MEAFHTLTGVVASLNRINVDTDAIIPKQFLKRIERTGFGQFLFHDWRFLENGDPNPDFSLNEKRFRGSTILLAQANFGCGSSREHAPWALQDYGFRVIIAPSFADIFYNNCFKNGLLPITLPQKTIDELFDNIANNDGYSLTVNLEQETIADDHGFSVAFSIDPFRRELLLKGLDDIGLTLQHETRIDAYEETYPSYYRIERH